MPHDATHDPVCGANALPAPGWVATGPGYTRAIALASVGPGWASLIHFLFDLIERRQQQQDTSRRPLPIRVAQVKEKFGGLRFYYDRLENTDEETEEVEMLTRAVRLAEHLSFYLCEQCGALGRPRRGGWVRTLCDTHATTRGESAT
jgi:hypothetical protein